MMIYGVKMISGGNIATLLGKNSLYVISSAVFVAVLFFYIFSVGSYFHVQVAPLENRVNFHEPFSVYVINEFVDHIIISYGIVVWLGLSIQGKARFVSSGIYGAITTIAILANLQTLFDV